MNYKKIIKKLEEIDDKCCNFSCTFDFLQKTSNDEAIKALLNMFENYSDEIRGLLDKLINKLENNIDKTKIIPLWPYVAAKGYTAELNEDNSKINIFNSDKEADFTLELKNIIENLIKKETEKAEKGNEKGIKNDEKS